MPILQIRDVPMSVYKKLKEMAKTEKRSVSQQALLILEKGLIRPEDRIARRKALFELIKKSWKTLPKSKLDSTKMIREDRDR
jgi:hypothetical protein